MPLTDKMQNLSFEIKGCLWLVLMHMTGSELLSIVTHVYKRWFIS